MPPEQYCYFQNRLMPMWEARVAPDDLGILHGYAVYENVTAYGTFPFHFKEHWAHFEASAKAVGLHVPLSEEEAFNACSALIKKNTAEDARATLRMVLSGGPAVNGLEYDHTRSALYILCEERKPIPESSYEKGEKLITHDYHRSMADVKTIQEIVPVMLQHKRKEADAADVLYHHNGQAYECATSNFFIVEDGRVVTPGGITRALAIKLAKEGRTVEERNVTMDEVFVASEAFITSSSKDIMPIVSIDGKEIGDGKPGPVTRDLIRRFKEHVKDGGQG
jgi:branched-chain amino acid aminotransferase